MESQRFPENDVARPDTVHHVLYDTLAEESLCAGNGGDLESVKPHE